MERLGTQICLVYLTEVSGSDMGLLCIFAVGK